jgi:ribonucleoside-diphosphate reductase alpha chain
MATAEVVYLDLEEEYLGIKIDRTKDNNLSEQARKLLKDYYQLKEETSAQQSYARAAVAYSYGDMDLAQRIYDYVSEGWFMFASPVLSNAPLPGAKVKSLPISCFLTYVPDSLEGLIDHSAELRWLSVKGGGVGGHWSAVRAVSDKAPGPMPFLHTVDADMTAYRQGRTRKGSYAAYMDISHPDIIEFVNMRIPTGDVNRKNLNLHHAVNVTDSFMRAVERDEVWDLVDPDDGTVRDSMRARKLWELLLETRYRTGEPYLNFIDTANRALPQTMKEKGLKIHGSNLCKPREV